jgi:hypothetical protein
MKRIFDTKVEGRREIGRHMSKVRCKENLEQDNRLLEERNLKSGACKKKMVGAVEECQSLHGAADPIIAMVSFI